MALDLPSSLEETISVYKSKYLIDLDDENDDTLLLDNSDQEKPNDGRHNLRGESDDNDDAQISDPKVPRSRLPKDLAGLMGQANVCFARGNHADAIAMCQEVIRHAPKCAEPFISLAEFYQDNDDEEKAEQLYLIAAYLQPSNVDLWVRVAESATRRREFRLATTCYTKAIRMDKTASPTYVLKRSELYEQLGDQKKALKGYENLVSSLRPDDEILGLELMRGISRVYFTENQVDECIRTLESAFNKYTNLLSGDDISQLARCYNFKEDFLKTIDLMVQRCGIKIKINNSNDWSYDLIKSCYKQHPKLVLDFESENKNFKLTNKFLLAVAFVSIGYHDDTIKVLVCSLDNADVTIFSKSLYEVADAYFKQGIYSKAKNVLSRLTNQRDSQTASVWLLFSQCLKNLDEIDEAIKGYREVVALEPEDYSSRLALSNLLSVQGRSEEALEVTVQELFTEKPVDIPLLFQSCKLLEQAKKWSDYCKAAKALLLTNMTYTQNYKEIMSMITSRSLRTRTENLRYVQRDVNVYSSAQRQKSTTDDRLDHGSMLKIFLKYIELLYHVFRDYQELKRICFSAYTCPSFEHYESSIDFYSAIACIISEDKDFTYTHLKLMASRNHDNNQIWNLLSVAMSNIYQDLRHGRFIFRQFLKNPDVLPLALFHGHNNLMSGSYKHASQEFMNIYRERPNDSFAAFSVALSFLSLTCQKYVSSKYLCLFQMMAFLHAYLELRGTCQEAMYNIGRVFHQMNMLDKAVIFYKKALEMDDRPRISSMHDQDEFDEIFNVRREAAFNLSLIYKNSQSYRLAYQVIRDNFTI